MELLHFPWSLLNRCSEGTPKEWLVLQSVDFRGGNSLVLDENLECAAHSIRTQQLNHALEVARTRLQLLNGRLSTKADEKTHLVRVPREVKAVFLPHGSEDAEIHM